MSTRIATDEAVARAIAALEARGSAVTSDHVIKELGGGSKVTVTRMLREYRARSNAQGSDDDLPAALVHAARPMLASLYEMARNTELARYQQASERMNVIMNGLEDELEAARSNEEELEQALEREREHVSELRHELADLARRSEAAEQRSNIAEQANARLAAENKTLMSRLDGFEKDMAAALEREKRLMQALENLSATRSENTPAPLIDEEVNNEAS